MLYEGYITKPSTLKLTTYMHCQNKNKCFHLNAADLLLSGRFMNLADDMYFLMAGRASNLATNADNFG